MSDLITAQEAIKNFPSETNVNPSKIEKFCDIATQKWVKNIVSWQYYNQLVINRAGCSLALTGDDLALWNAGLLQLSAYAVFYEALPFIGLSVAGVGIMQNRTEFGSSVGSKDIGFLQDSIRDNIGELEKKVIWFMRNAKASDPTKYPLFEPNGESTERTQDIDLNCGVIMPDRCNTDKWYDINGYPYNDFYNF